MYLVLCTNTVSMFIEKLLLSIRKLSINQKSTASFVMSLSQKAFFPCVIFCLVFLMSAFVTIACAVRSVPLIITNNFDNN